MMKKLVLCFVCFMALAFQVQAADVSVGVAGDLGFIFTKVNTNLPEPDKSIVTMLEDIDMTRWGISAFIDARYIEANAGFKFFVQSYSGYGTTLKETDTFFNLGLKVKYPFKVNEKVTIFPLAGFDYAIFTKAEQEVNGQSATGKRDDLASSNEMDRLSLNLGLGADFSVNKNIYVRGELNYAILFNTEQEKDLINLAEAAGYDLSIFESGPVFKLGIGYKF
ncbi:MAG: outer membrane beta-barrel protein [Spirochaetaceae bacterium]|jgi:opacity protein-like surface antigen|nr:outer membrane beta-barrel protein [Spirochaetaceae bacterium]